MQNHCRCWGFLPLIVSLAAGIAGCADQGPKRIAVTGTVKLDGKPVERGSISFIPPTGSEIPSTSAEIKAGEYVLPAEAGPAIGKYRVEVRWSRPTGKKIPVGSPAPPGTMMDEVREAIPAKYNTQSTLEREISPGDETVDFDLES